MSMTFRPRPKQQEVLAYRGGKMGVSAVPGSGKTQTLSYLAAQIVAGGELGPEQEVLIVTLVNAAVDNFAHRVAGILRAKGLLPHVGYRVRTLHGLAHDVIRDRPSLAGLSDAFQILDEYDAQQIIRRASEGWLHGNPQALDGMLRGDLTEAELRRIRRRNLPRHLGDVAVSFIHQAKDLGLSPPELNEKLGDGDEEMPVLRMACEVYALYQQALAYRGAVDFNDLISKALLALRTDRDYRQRLRNRWPFILEDEAQDSSRLQEEILRELVGKEGNWVRVGDPNQAIYETFTTASPEFLRDFMEQTDVQAKELPNSGRFTRSIMDLANELIDWTRTRHPVPGARSALTPPKILPTPSGDPQPNPEDDPQAVHLVGLAYTPQEELEAVAIALERWLADHPQKTVAVLVPSNYRGFELSEVLEARGLPYLEVLRSTKATRASASALVSVLRHLIEPVSAKALVDAYRIWRVGNGRRADPETVEESVHQMSGCRDPESYLWPHPDRDWLRERRDGLPDGVVHELEAFRSQVRRWHASILLPVDQMILALAQDLFREAVDLAVSHKLAGVMKGIQEGNPGMELPELVDELEKVAENERRFIGLDRDERAFDPDQHRGVVVVTTVHKAKGLEWDRVLLISVNNYDYPAALPKDRFISEKHYLRESFNLEAETLAQLKKLAEGGLQGADQAGDASMRSRVDYASERLRLLYVGITRARRSLTITWNSGRYGDAKQALAFRALQSYWEERTDESAD
jgi:DNA helicase-2/ATP-dependent DNA helicase PcrA